MNAAAWLVCSVLALGSGLGCAAPASNATKVDPAALRKQLARSLMAYREWSSASKPLRELVQMQPKDPEVHAMLGHVYREQGLYDQAEAEYRAALALDGKQAEAYGGLGLVADLRGDAGDGAVEALQKAVELQPDNAAFRNNLGFAFYVRGRYREAEAAYHEALRRDPTLRRIRNNLGFVYARLGDFHRAQREFERGGSPAAAENNLGFAFEQAGKLAAACESYHEAERRDPRLKSAAVNADRICPAGSLSPSGGAP
jgi:Flp pilus assembly protein TadD